MALINCEECGKEISDKASICPHCGAPVEHEIIAKKQEELKHQKELESQKQEDELIRQKKYKEELKRQETPLANSASIAIGWLFGIIFVIAAFGTLISGNILAGFFYLVASSFLLPSIRKIVYAKTNITIQPNYRIALVLFAVVLAGIAISSAESARVEEAKQKFELEQAAREVAQKEKEQKEFKDNKEKILQGINDQIKSKAFKDALPTCNTYMKLGDKDLTPLCTTVKTEITKIEQKEQAERVKKEAAEAAKAKAKAEAELKKSMGEKAWKFHNKHPSWSTDECKGVAKHQYWIGMTTEMMVASLGRPNTAKPSNYGSGRQWQYCYTDGWFQCFYDSNDDGIIDSYN
ncbi:MAG: hypothetical protein CJD30_11535 [Sulfuricurvum sp. PD_MW2]|jgi:hypothetical protein|uniref:zinc ribbon domain-containing protein n=1 Tax=Sulfuricurvum sp. PD_MW2 TaxID=2027917 RepID=UPI000C0667AA|nr:zinc ribbon domain-containing protein [Sulfuricurvum sp. PD_MW2]PHM16443.1 MAG: hypothetical protein CJD30_11535 [Sulfuricurvum sp. PD_MW2]